MRKIVVIGFSAALILFLVYLGILTLAQGLEHALGQTAQLWYWLVALAVGFGVQVSLFSVVRQGLRQRRAYTASLVTSGGVSTSSMVACCAHHLSDVLPLLGFSALAAFLVNYQLFFIVVGVLANAVGIAIMLETIQRHGLCPWLARLQLDMGWVKKGTMISAVLIALVTLFSYF